MDERKMAPHVARAIGAVQAKPAAAGPWRPAVAPHVARAIGALQAKPEAVQNRYAAPPTPAAPSRPAPPPAVHVRQAVAPVQAKRLHGNPGPPAKPAAGPLPAKAVQRMRKDWHDDDDDFKPHCDEVEEGDREEESYEKRAETTEKNKGNARPSKPSGLIRKFFEKNPRLRDSTPDLEERDIYKSRKNKTKKAPAHLGKVDITHKIECNRCHTAIRLTKNFQEAGVGFSSKKKRKKPPLGHVVDYSIYKNELALRSEEVPENYRSEYLKVGSWDRKNLGVEHFDCNSKANKITAKNIKDEDLQRGILYVGVNHERWLKKAKKRIDK